MPTESHPFGAGGKLKLKPVFPTGKGALDKRIARIRA
jgi:hypothetical protein